MLSMSAKHLILLCLPSLLAAVEPAATPPPSTVAEAATKPAASIPAVIVTTTREAVPLQQTAQTVRTLEAVQLQERQVRTLTEALRETPGVNVQKTSNAQGSPFIRGFTGFRNLALIDGIRFNNSTFREGPNQYWNTIDSWAIDRLELVPGQGSVLYGSDAIGGTLNLLTQDSGFRDEDAGFFFHGLTAYRASTAERSHVGRQELQFGEGGRWGLHLGASLKSFGDVRAAGLGLQPNTGYDEWAYDARLDLALDDSWTITAVHQQLRQSDAWRTHQTTSGISWEGTTVGTDLQRSYDQERTLSYLRLAGLDLDGFADSASLTVSLQTADEYEFRERTTRRDFSQVEISTLGLDLQLSSDTAIGRLTYGIDYYRDWVSSGSQRYNKNGTRSRGIQGPVGDDASYDLLGLYLQDQFDLTSRLHAQLGGRFTHAAADIGRFADPATPAPVDSYRDDWQNFSASLRLLYDLDEQERHQLFGGVSQGFRAPNLSDLSRLDVARSGELETPSTGLDPEQFINFELGLRTQTDRFRGSLSYFYTVIDDMIVRRPVGAGIVNKSNSGDGFMQGVELDGSWRLDECWTLFGHLTWTEGRVEQYPRTNSSYQQVEPISRVVPLMGRAGLRWERTDKRVWGEFLCLAHSRYERLNSGDRRDTQRIPPGGNPGFAHLTLRGGWRVTQQLELTAALENLLDQEYRYTGSGSNEPGFGAVLGATLRF
jgi:hemoglobin/transferrin/lactoferrin receptor protein